MRRQTTLPPPLKVMVSYSHEDNAQKTEVTKCLRAISPNLPIDEWDDNRMLAGDNIDETIFREIDRADIFLALISRNYLSSAYCREEMQAALARAEQRHCRVVPIIVRKTDAWRSWPIGQNLALPPNGKAPSDWPDPDDHWSAVEVGLNRLVERLLTEKAEPSEEAAGRSGESPTQIRSEPSACAPTDLPAPAKPEATARKPKRPQTAITAPRNASFEQAVRKTLIELFSNPRLSGAVTELLDTDEGDASDAAEALLKLEPLNAIDRWTKVVTTLYRKMASAGEAREGIWDLLESVHFRLLPRLVDVSGLSNHPDIADDMLLFTIAAPHAPPNRPVELLFARMNDDHLVQFVERGLESRDTAVPPSAINPAEIAQKNRNDPDVASAVEQIGFELMRRFKWGRDIPEQIEASHWVKLDALIEHERSGLRSSYMVISHDSNYADPAVLSLLYENLPNLPKFLMAPELGDGLPFVCDPVHIDAVIEVFWNLKREWMG